MGLGKQLSLQNAGGKSFLPLVFALGLQNLHYYFLLLNKESPYDLLPHSLVAQHSTVGPDDRKAGLRKEN